MSEIADLINAVRGGDVQEYREVVLRFRDMVFGYTFSILGDVHLAEDAAQEAFSEAYANLRELKEPAAFPGWLRRIVQRQCSRMTRGKRVAVTELKAAERILTCDPTPLDIAIHKESTRLVRVAISSLPPVQREVTSLFYLGGSSHAAIADFLEMPVGTVKHQLYLARQNLKERMVNMHRPRVLSLAPQFLVDDLEQAMAYYRDRLGFEFGEPWGGFYAIGRKDGLELHFKEAKKNESERKHRRDHEHLDAAAGVEGIDAFYQQCVAAEVKILKPLAPTLWGTKDFYIEDPDGYIICFGGH